MPIRKNLPNFLVCAVLAVSVACVYGQNSTSQPSTSKTPAPSTTTAASSKSSTASSTSADDCAGPVLHRSAANGGDVCSSQAPEPQPETLPSGGIDANGQAANFNPNVDPFKQVQPLPDGMMPGVKKGSIEDINAVGTRCIGCRGIGNWYSSSWEVRTGASYAQQIDKSTRFVTDPVVDEYINRIGQNIVRNSDCKVPFTIKVIDSDVINSFALPGGFIFINSGLILAADEEDELAAVMSHETAHVCAHHAARQMTRSDFAQIGMIPLIMMTGYSWTGYGIYEGAQLMIPITFLQFSREFEAQADYLGTQYLYKSGYDPMGMVDFFEKINNLEKQKPGIFSRIFADHPVTPDRILATEQEIATILPPRSEYLVTTSEFNDVKARLARIENKRRLLQKNTHRPSLRQASNRQDQPTLHQRPDDTNSN